MARTQISRNSRSLEVKLRSQFFYSIKPSKFTPYISNFQSLGVLYLSNQNLGPVPHISLFFTLLLSKSGRFYTPVKCVIITPDYLEMVNAGGWPGRVNSVFS